MSASEQPTDTDGWTIIGRSKRGGTVKVPAHNGPDKDITLEQLQATFDKHTRVWQQSSCREKLVRLLERHHAEAVAGISTAVFLASGSFSRLNLEASRRAMLQLACSMDIAAEIGRMAGTDVKMYAQEPQLSEMDKALLASKEITVLDIPLGDSSLGEANALLGPQTALFEFFMDMGQDGLEALLRAGTKLYVGSSLIRHSKLGWPVQHGWKGDVEMLLERFKKEHAQRFFPDFVEDPNVFRGLMVHWREEQDEDLEGESEWRGEGVGSAPG